MLPELHGTLPPLRKVGMITDYNPADWSYFKVALYEGGMFGFAHVSAGPARTNAARLLFTTPKRPLYIGGGCISAGRIGNENGTGFCDWYVTPSGEVRVFPTTLNLLFGLVYWPMA